MKKTVIYVTFDSEFVDYIIERWMKKNIRGLFGNNKKQDIVQVYFDKCKCKGVYTRSKRKLLNSELEEYINLSITTSTLFVVNEVPVGKKSDSICQYIIFDNQAIRELLFEMLMDYDDIIFQVNCLPEDQIYQTYFDEKTCTGLYAISYTDSLLKEDEMKYLVKVTKPLSVSNFANQKIEYSKYKKESCEEVFNAKKKEHIVIDNTNRCILTDKYDQFNVDSIEKISSDFRSIAFEFEEKKYSLEYCDTYRYKFYGYDKNRFISSDDTVEWIYIFSNKGFEISFEREYVERLTRESSKTYKEKDIICEAEKLAKKYIDFGKGKWKSDIQESGIINGRRYYVVRFKLILKAFITDFGVDIMINDAGIIKRLTYFTGNVDYDTIAPKINEDSIKSSFVSLAAKHNKVEEKDITNLNYESIRLFVNSSKKICIEYLVHFYSDVKTHNFLEESFSCTAIFD